MKYLLIILVLVIVYYIYVIKNNEYFDETCDNCKGIPGQKYIYNPYYWPWSTTPDMELARLLENNGAIVDPGSAQDVPDHALLTN